MSSPADRRRSLVDAAWVSLAALVVRSLVVAWAWSKIPPIADGYYYDVLARRLARGLGYTWEWPDGAVTHAAHYPVGYPALAAGIYRVFGETPGFVMLANALFGALAVFACHRIAARGGTRLQALVAGSLVACHPDLVTYTPALMTEGVTAALVTVVLWLALRLSERPSLARILAAALALAMATYVRPQCLVLGPLLPVALARGATASARWKRAGLAALAVTGVALLAIAPWSARNCARMGRCALVSVNDGWNLLIGTNPAAWGGWAEVVVPERCAGIEDEAETNACFGTAARDEIAAHPLAWASLAPRKLAVTFNYAGAGPWYLRAANPDALSEPGKRVLGGVTVLFERLAVAGALIAVARRLAAMRAATGSRAAASALVIAVAGVAWCFVPDLGWLGVVALAVSAGAAVALDRERRLPPILALVAVQVASTAVVHAVFFGSGRYALVTFPVVTVLAAFSVRPREF